VHNTEELRWHGDFGGARRQGFVVACDPGQTKLREDCVECAELHDGSMVVRVHMVLSAKLNCKPEADRGARLATLTTFAATTLCESTPWFLSNSGFTKGWCREALTVESVFDGVPSAERYHLNHAKSRVYLSRVTLTETVTDEELYQYLCPAAARGVTVEVTAAMCRNRGKSTKKALRVPGRIYKLLKCLGWGCRLFEHCSTTRVYGAGPHAAPLLRQRFNPDYHGAITQFCFRYLVSEALLRIAREYVTERPGVCLPLVCRLPCGTRAPVLTARQAEMLRAQGFGRDLAAGVVSAVRWRRVRKRATKRSVKLLQMFVDPAEPLRDGDGVVLKESFVRYTAALVQNCHCYVVANKPLRDYPCLMNSRCAACLVRKCHAGPNGRHAVLDAWVKYWERMQCLVVAHKRELASTMLYCHLQRVFGVEGADVRTAVVEGLVCECHADGAVVVVLLMLRRATITMQLLESEQPTLGSPVLFSVRADRPEQPSIEYISDVRLFTARLKRSYVAELKMAALKEL
jgi:hypothetical protein